MSSWFKKGNSDSGFLRQLSELLTQDAEQKTLETEEEQLQYASIGLLLEVAFADGNLSDEEEAKIFAVLTEHFDLTDSLASDILDKSKLNFHDAVSTYEFSRPINEFATYAEKCRLVAFLWHLAYVDDHLDPYEEHQIRKISDLLHVSHSDFIYAKLHHEQIFNA